MKKLTHITIVHHLKPEKRIEVFFHRQGGCRLYRRASTDSVSRLERVLQARGVESTLHIHRSYKLKGES